MRPRGKYNCDLAGIHATAGREAPPRVQAAANELGIIRAEHRARAFDHEMIESSDAILAMDYQNSFRVVGTISRVLRKGLHAGRHAEGVGQYREISDPYYGDLENTRICARQLQVYIRNLIGSLFPDLGPLQQTDSMASQEAGSTDKSMARHEIAGEFKLLWSRLRKI
jgi:protein-tyrosine-phosphatase